MKRIIAISLAATLAISPMIVKGEDLLDKDIIPISAPIAIPISERDYIEYQGKIVSIEKYDGKTRILVEKELEEGTDSLIVHLSDDVILLDDKSMDFVESENLAEGMEVSVFYHKNTPVALSLPPQLTPNVIVLRNGEGKGVEVSKFSNEFLNSEGSLYVRPGKDTVIIDKDGNKIEESELASRDWIAFYGIVLESYPAQTYADKIVVLPEREKDPNILEVELKENEVFKNEEGVVMIPLRQVAEELGYEVTWNQESKSAEILRGPQWSLITIGKDSYNFARMHIELGTAPILKDSKTYVPLSFGAEVLKATIKIIS